MITRKNIEALREFANAMKTCNFDGIDVLEMALDLTKPQEVKVETSRADSLLLADEPGEGALIIQDCNMATPGAKRQESSEKRRRKRSEIWEQEEWWAYRTATVRSDHGPKWEQIHRRVTMDRDTNELIEDVQVIEGSEPCEYRYELKCGGCRNTITRFV